VSGARLALRLGVLLCLATAALTLLALQSEYPGSTRAGMRVALEEPLPLALLAWLHLVVLDRPRRVAVAAALAADALYIALALPSVVRAGFRLPPLPLAEPFVALLLAAATLAMAREASRRA